MTAWVRFHWNRIDRIRTSKVGAVLFYGYLIAIVTTGALVGRVMLINRAQIRANESAIQQLCEQGATLRDVVVGGIAVVYAELQDPKVPKATHVADRMFLARFHRDLRDVNYLLNNPRSACQKETP